MQLRDRPTHLPIAHEKYLCRAGAAVPRKDSSSEPTAVSRRGSTRRFRMLLRERIVGFQDLLGARTTSVLEIARREGDARIAVEIEVAAILAQSKDRVGERGGSRGEQESQETRSRAKRREATDAGAARRLFPSFCTTQFTDTRRPAERRRFR